LTAIRLSQDNNNNSSNTTNDSQPAMLSRNRATEAHTTQPISNYQRPSYQSTNSVKSSLSSSLSNSHERIKPTTNSNAGLSVQVRNCILMFDLHY